jgi:lysophospholipase
VSNRQPRFINAGDGTRLRTQTWDAAPGSPQRGVCVLLSGQTEFFEKYQEVIVELCGRGFAVAALDWRGQGGSARLLPNPLKAHIHNFSEYDDDLKSFMEQIVKPLIAQTAPGKAPIALAHSMGGHILMRGLHDRPKDFAAAVFSAPMLRTQSRGYPGFLVRAIAFVQNARGAKDDWVWGMSKRDPRTMKFSDQLVTSDPARFARTQKLIVANPDLRLSGPTWGWLEAAFSSMAQTFAPGYAEAITTPILIVGAGKDRIVDTRGAREFIARVPHGEYVELADAEHEILMENDSIRARFWAAFDSFVARYTAA